MRQSEPQQVREQFEQAAYTYSGNLFMVVNWRKYEFQQPIHHRTRVTDCMPDFRRTPMIKGDAVIGRIPTDEPFSEIVDDTLQIFSPQLLRVTRLPPFTPWCIHVFEQSAVEIKPDAEIHINPDNDTLSLPPEDRLEFCDRVTDIVIGHVGIQSYCVRTGLTEFCARSLRQLEGPTQDGWIHELMIFEDEKINDFLSGIIPEVRRERELATEPATRPYPEHFMIRERITTLLTDALRWNWHEMPQHSRINEKEFHGISTAISVMELIRGLCKKYDIEIPTA